MVLSAWLIHELVRISIVVVLHALLHFFEECLLEPVFGGLFAVSLIDLVLVLVFYVGNNELDIFELLVAEFAAEADAVLKLSCLRPTVHLEVALVELLFRIDIVFGSIFNSIDSLFDILCQE